ncbi:MAG: hypothetical protein ABJF11_01135 [Reichenbachiella sp.]|uniref:hypothetical protein n=1 Tax=Reichenbachiella sp. TaxID=2184521 RepID=UPI0032664E54
MSFDPKSKGPAPSSIALLKDRIKGSIAGAKKSCNYKKFAIAIKKGTPDYSVPVKLSKSVSATVNKPLFKALKGFSKIIPYQGCTTNCVNMGSLSLWLNGIPNIGIHPFLLHSSMTAYNAGVRPDLFSYYLH